MGAEAGLATMETLCPLSKTRVFERGALKTRRYLRTP